MIRKSFFDSILRQDIGFFDTNSAGELNTRLAEDVKKVADGMGDKIGITVQSLARFFAGLTIGKDHHPENILNCNRRLKFT